MSNKICQVTDGRLAQAAVGSIRRATCTDPSWNETVCGDFCLSKSGPTVKFDELLRRLTDLPSFELEGELTPCGDNVFVCSAYAKDNSANCALKQKVFTLPVGSAETIIALPTGTTATSAIPVSTTSSSAMITSARPSPSTTSEADEDQDESGKSKTRTIAIAAGVGGAAALAAGLGLIWFFCIRKRRSNLRSSYSTTESLDKPTMAVHASYETTPAMQPNEVPRPQPAQPPVAPDSDMHDGRPRYNLYDDGETEISSAGLGDASAIAAQPVQRPENGRAHVLRTAPSHLTVAEQEEADVPSIFGRPEGGRVSTLSYRR